MGSTADVAALCMPWRLPTIRHLRLEGALECPRKLNILSTRLPRLFNLKQITFYNQAVGRNVIMSGIQTLERCPRSFEKIVFDRCRIDNASLQMIMDTIARIKWLKGLAFLDCDVSESSMTTVIGGIQDCSTLRELMICGPQFDGSAEEMSALARWLANDAVHLTDLTMVDFAVLGKKPYHEILLQSLYSSHGLSSLNYAYNLLNDRCFNALADFVARSTGLKELVLAHCKLQSTAAGLRLLSAIRESTTLRTLVLNHNCLDIGMMQTLCQSIQANTSLRRVGLTHNPVFLLSNEGTKMLAETMEHCTNIERVEITRSPPPYSMKYDRLVHWYAYLNRSGRRAMCAEGAFIPSHLWAIILEKLQCSRRNRELEKNPEFATSALYFFLREGVHI